jgi:hypothetical protein
MVSRVGSIIVDRSAELAESVEVLKTAHKGKFRYSPSPTIIMRPWDCRAVQGTLATAGRDGRKERPAEQNKGNCSNDI